MRGIPHMVATMNCQSTSNACRRGNCLWFSTPTGEHGTHTKEGTTKGEREMTEVACSGQHGK